MEHPFHKEAQAERKPGFSIQPLILDRWSPRSMTGEGLSDAEFFPLLEAARWAPSSYNNQPWRFLYAKKDTPNWQLFFDLLVEANQAWCKDAAVLICVVSHMLLEHNDKPSKTHSFDAGAAWMALALEGSSRGLVVHGMEGFDWERAVRVLEVPSDYRVEAMVAVGKRGPTDHLPQNLKEREKPSPRKSVDEIAIEGKFNKKKSSKP